MIYSNKERDVRSFLHRIWQLANKAEKRGNKARAKRLRDHYHRIYRYQRLKLLKR